MQNYLITNRQPSATKKGPGRYHKAAGHRKATPPRRDGVPIGSVFMEHSASNAKTSRRELVRAIGRRQAIKQVKAARREYAEA